MYLLSDTYYFSYVETQKMKVNAALFRRADLAPHFCDQHKFSHFLPHHINTGQGCIINDTSTGTQHTFTYVDAVILP
jgi:hypothetical protein